MSDDALPAQILVMQGSCCGSACENCPYTPRHEGGSMDLDQEFVKFDEANPGKGYQEYLATKQQ